MRQKKRHQSTLGLFSSHVACAFNPNRKWQFVFETGRLLQSIIVIDIWGCGPGDRKVHKTHLSPHDASEVSGNYGCSWSRWWKRIGRGWRTWWWPQLLYHLWRPGLFVDILEHHKPEQIEPRGWDLNRSYVSVGVPKQRPLWCWMMNLWRSIVVFVFFEQQLSIWEPPGVALNECFGDTSIKNWDFGACTFVFGFQPTLQRWTMEARFGWIVYSTDTFSRGKPRVSLLCLASRDRSLGE